MFRPYRLLIRTDSCTAVPVPVPVAGIYKCICIYACMRAVQNCMLARGSAPQKYYWLFHHRLSQAVLYHGTGRALLTISSAVSSRLQFPTM